VLLQMAENRQIMLIEFDLFRNKNNCCTSVRDLVRKYMVNMRKYIIYEKLFINERLNS
jgi:hypothetical protein